MITPFLKYPGNKRHLIAFIGESFVPGRRVIEPFAGSAAVYLGLGHHYEAAVLSDINPDIIALYRNLCAAPEKFIAACEQLFTPEINTPCGYYALRDRFNAAQQGSDERSLILPVLNRVCYNGLMRYNRRGSFNVPLGRYLAPEFPTEQMRAFAMAASKAEFRCANFREIMELCGAGDVVYCDPPYAPLSDTADFTAYSGTNFSMADQQDLVTLAHAAADRGAHVLISNHDTSVTRELYRDADAIRTVMVSRTISRNGQARDKVPELLAIYGANPNLSRALPEAA